MYFFSLLFEKKQEKKPKLLIVFIILFLIKFIQSNENTKIVIKTERKQQIETHNNQNDVRSCKINKQPLIQIFQNQNQIKLFKGKGKKILKNLIQKIKLIREKYHKKFNNNNVNIRNYNGYNNNNNNINVFKKKKVKSSYIPTKQLITSRNYPFERHIVKTIDGYYLTFQRIPFNPQKNRKVKVKKCRGVVIFQHGLLDSSETWVLNDNSLPFILSNLGYDVWLTNSRGNRYGDIHEKYSKKDDKFWDFSINEFSSIDFPTTINYILKTTKVKKIKAFFGHSQGGAMAFGGLSEHVELQDKIEYLVGLAPAMFLTNVRAVVIKFLADHIPQSWDYHLFGKKDVTEVRREIFETLIPKLCDFVKIGCYEFYCLFFGCNALSGITKEELPRYLAHTPSSTSTKDIIHYHQLINSFQFQKFDYNPFDKKKNMKVYGQNIPPKYDLSKINNKDLKIIVFYGGEDYLVHRKGIEEKLLKQIPKKNLIFSKFIEEYGHNSFVWSPTSDIRIFKDIEKFF